MILNTLMLFLLEISLIIKRNIYLKSYFYNE